MCSPNYDGKVHIVSIVESSNVLIILGAFWKRQSALDFAQLVAEESGLPIVECGWELVALYSESLTKTDNQALNKPARSMRMKIRASEE
jgi:hypothetical protein